MPGYLIKAANFVAEIANDDELRQLAQVDTIKKDTLVRVLPDKEWVPAKSLPVLRKVWGLDAEVVPPPIPKAVKPRGAMPPRLETVIDYRPNFEVPKPPEEKKEAYQFAADAQNRTTPASVAAPDENELAKTVRMHEGVSGEFHAIISDVMLAVSANDGAVDNSIQAAEAELASVWEDEDDGNCEKTVAMRPPAPPQPQNIDDVVQPEEDARDASIEDLSGYAVQEEAVEDISGVAVDEDNIDDLSSVAVEEDDTVPQHPGLYDTNNEVQDLADLNPSPFADDEVPRGIQELDECEISSNASSDGARNTDDTSSIFSGISIEDKEDPTGINDLSEVSEALFDRINPQYNENDEASPSEVTRVITDYDPNPSEIARNRAANAARTHDEVLASIDETVSKSVELYAAELDNILDGWEESSTNWGVSEEENERIQQTIEDIDAVPKGLAISAQDLRKPADEIEKRVILPASDVAKLQPQIPESDDFEKCATIPANDVSAVPEKPASADDLENRATVPANKIPQIPANAPQVEIQPASRYVFNDSPRHTLPGVGGVPIALKLDEKPPIPKQTNQDKDSSPRTSRRNAMLDIPVVGDNQTSEPAEVPMPSEAVQDEDIWKDVPLEPKPDIALASTIASPAPNRICRTHQEHTEDDFDDSPTNRAYPDVDSVCPDDAMTEELRAARAAVEAAKRAAYQTGELSSNILRKAAELVDALEIAHASGVFRVVNDRIQTASDADHNNAMGMRFENAKTRKNQHPATPANNADLVPGDLLDESPSEKFKIRSRKELEQLMQRELQKDRTCLSPDDDESSSDKLKVRGGSMLRRMMAEEARAVRTDSREMPAPDLSSSSNMNMRQLFQQSDELHLVLAQEVRQKESSVLRDMPEYSETESPIHRSPEQAPPASQADMPGIESRSITDDLPMRNDRVVAVVKPKPAEVTQITTLTDPSKPAIPVTLDDAFFKDKLEPGEQLIARFDTLYLTSRRLWNIKGRKYVSAYESYDIQDVQWVALKEERKWLLLVIDVILTLGMAILYIFYPHILIIATVIYGIVMFPICLIIFFKTSIQIGLQGGTLVRSESSVTRRNRAQAMEFLSHVDATRLTRRRQLGI